MIISSGGRVYYVRFRQSLIHFCASALRSLMSSTAPARTIHAHKSSCACGDTCSCNTTLQYAQLAPASGLAVSSAPDLLHDTPGPCHVMQCTPTNLLPQRLDHGRCHSKAS